MNKRYCIIFLLFLSNYLFAQEENIKHSFTFDVGFHYHLVYNHDYTPYADTNTFIPGPNKVENENVSFEYKNTFSFQAGFLYGHKLYKNINLKAVLYYFNHRYVWEGNKDSIIKYNPKYST